MDNGNKMPATAAVKSKGWKSWSTKKKFFTLFLVVLILVALAVGLGVGLGLGLKNNGGSGEGSEPTPSAPAPTTTPTGNNTEFWKPSAGTTWQIELLYTLNDTSVDVEVYDIDLFNSGADLISGLQKDGRKVICYFSAGSWENWRPDAGNFSSADLGGTLDGWPNEKWLNISSSSVRDIMKTRLDMAYDKGCDGVDPDNVDGYSNKENGLGLTQEDSIDYVNFLASEAHSRNMSIGLKNAGEIIDSVIDNMEWSVNEQCAQYNECDTFMPFTDANKPVFHIEYPKDDTNNNKVVTTSQKNAACKFNGSGKFSTIIKNMDLDNWIETC
ncbi:hypothetical protein PISL3812_05309 [Talaromyces islandicus]|uniref:alpha-galactosidase n=1 Tax=Talaromyces islandicus TaxID=28573 RepID=A0A0U1LZW7_TALIS|nr:hypothetical protein PISL3812_05309 [Talaromyces islandicus]